MPESSSVDEALTGVRRPDTVRVLHVDDDPEFAEVVSLYLERIDESFDVVTESSVDAGLDRLDRESVDCIVSDYDMPTLNGLEFLEAVRDRDATVPFVLFTGKGSEAIASEAISAGVTDYLQKGGGTEQYTILANRISNGVRQARAERETRRGFEAMNAAREGIALLEDDRFVFVNGAYAEIFEYDRDELIGKGWEILYPDEAVDEVREEVLSAVPETGRWRGETINLTASGERIVVDQALTYTDDGTLICLADDVTRERATERELESTRRQFESFVDAVTDYAIFTLDVDGYVTSWNEGARRIKGYEDDEIRGRHISTFYPAEALADGYPDRLLEAALRDGSAEDKGPRVHADGSRFRAHVTITAVFDDDGTHRGFIKVTEDLEDADGTTDAGDDPDG